MQTLIAVLVAAFLGILLGFWLRSTSAKAEKAQSDQRKAQLEADLAGVRAQLANSQAESAARAGYESLAIERERILRDSSGAWATERESLRAELAAKSEIERRQSAQISQLETALKREREAAQEKLKLLTDARVELTHQFEALAGKILDEKSTKFTEQNKLNLDQLLNPLRVQITDFRGKVEEAQAQNLVGRTELTAHLKGLESLNKKLSEEAHNLATALRRDTKAQGNWGEIILLDILENSGLRKGEHFTFQESFLEEGVEGNPGQRRQTDVIVKLPEGRHLIIDSKVSLNSYNSFVSSTTDAERSIATKNHLVSVRRHFIDLAERNYPRLSGIQSPDFVVMFLPIEPAFMLAIQEDDELWQDAYKKGVLLAGPTTVLFVVRIVENLWRQERQVRSVEEIFERGRKLYEKFVGFAADLNSVGDKLRDAERSYQGAMNKLISGKDNLVRQAEKLKELGIRTNKQLPPKLLDAAGLDSDEQAELALAASGDEERVPQES